MTVTDDLERRIDELAARLAALEARPTRRRLRTLARPSVVIPVMSMLFALATAWVSYRQVEFQEVRERRAELRQLMQRFYEFPLAHAAAQTSYAGTPQLVQITDHLRSEQNLVVTQATAIAELLGDRLASAELYALSIALESHGDWIAAERFAERAVGGAEVFVERVASRRQYAKVLFTNGNADRAREVYREIVAIVDDVEDPIYRARENAATLGTWADWETARGDCEGARARAEEAHEYFASVGGVPELTPWLEGVQARARGCTRTE